MCEKKILRRRISALQSRMTNIRKTYLECDIILNVMKQRLDFLTMK